MKLRLIASLLLFAVMFSFTTSVAAQTYSFSLDEETVHVYWNDDGSVALDYNLVFTNSSSADPIDFVDMGMPNGSYDWNSISADANGSPLSLSSDFYGEGGSGFSVDMGVHAIQPGQTGRVHVYVGRISNMLHPDSDKPDTYASGEFSPNWFGSAYVYGSTNMTVVFHLPPGVQPDESQYHPVRGNWPCRAEPVADHDDQNRITYTWACSNASASRQYTFGLSFPSQYVPSGVIAATEPASSGKGLPFNINFDNLMGVLFFCCFGGIFFGAPILGAINERKRKLQYLPPKISLEGHGIKRGLTAAEAAILLEQPLDKVMTIILFGVVKKGAASVVTRDPLKLELASPLPEDLHAYEKDFLTAFAKPQLADQRKALQEMTVNLVKSVGEKMKGFSRRETSDYYKAIMARAWQQIEVADTPEVKSEMYEQAMEWTMLDKDYDARTRRVFTGPIFVPTWWGRYDPGYRPVSASSGGGPAVFSPSAPGSGRSSVPGASFAASVVSSVQGFSSRVLGNVQSFTSDVTSRTNPLPKGSASSGGWKGGSQGGGHSCACACACAGCACACAGGGR